MWRESYRHCSPAKGIILHHDRIQRRAQCLLKHFKDQLPNSPSSLPTTSRSLPFLTETIPSACTHRYSTLVFALFGYLLGLRRWRMSCCRGIATCFLTWRAGIVGSCCAAVHSVAGRCWVPVFKGPVGCLLLTLCFELGHALFFDVLLSEVVGAASGCKGQFMSAAIVGQRESISSAYRQRGSPIRA